MSLLPIDTRHLATAVDLARAAVGLASPNPTVGCVLAHGETILGQGAHHYDELDHAEIAALKQAALLGHNVSSATAYVTLEPCSHHGRTGPCADALIAAGIARCVIASVDPNPLVRGSGIARLRAAGIETIILDPVSPLALEARHLNDAFACSIQTGFPFFTLKTAVSLDGKIAPSPEARTQIAPHWITGMAARSDAQLLRHAADAILTGIGTVLSDDPSLTDRSGLPRRRPLLRVVLDADLRLPLASKLVLSAAQDVLVLCRANASADAEAALRNRGVEVHRLADDSRILHPNAVRDAISGRDLRNVMVEAGSRINASCLHAEIVDKVVIYYSETELGPDAIPFATGYPSPYVLQQSMTGISRAVFPNGNTEDIRITGYLHDPWSSVS